jgi:hypothetical protein
MYKMYPYVHVDRLSAEAEQALIDKIARSVVDKLIKGGPTTEHEGEENFNMHLVHGTDNEAEIACFVK